MKTAHIIFAAALAIATSTTMARAATASGFYIAGQGGVAWQTDKASDHALNGIDGKFVSDSAYTLGVAAGYAFPIHIRVEAEATIANGYHGHVYDPIGGGTGPVRQKAFFGMLNTYYDIPTDSSIHPYVGAGAGIVRATTHSDVDVGSGFTVTIRDADTTWAWQGIGGFSYDLIDDISLTLDYRWTRTGNVHQPTYLNGAPLSSMTTNASNQSVRTGVRWSF